MGVPLGPARPHHAERNARIHLAAAGERPRPFRRHLDRPGSTPTHASAAYASAKAATETWTLALADRFRGSGSTANIVVISAIVTDAMRAAEPDRSFETFVSDAEIAEAIGYLFSDGAGKMNGQRLVLRGSV